MTHKASKLPRELGREEGSVSKSLANKVALQLELTDLKNNLQKIKENQPPGCKIRQARKRWQGEIYHATFNCACNQRTLVVLQVKPKLSSFASKIHREPYLS